MNINQKCGLILRDLYSYDIVSAYPTILSKQFYDFEDVDLQNKQERSEFIGKKQINNENMSSFLMNSANSLVKFYLSENEVSDDHIIVTQRDGFILTRTIQNNNEFITMELRDIIELMIISMDRKKYLTSIGGTIDVKGVPHVYDSIMNIYSMFANLNFYNKKTLFQQMQSIKDAILNSQDIHLFAIPREEDSFAFITFNGAIESKDCEMISVDKIDKVKYFDNYIKPFLDSIFVETY